MFPYPGGERGKSCIQAVFIQRIFNSLTALHRDAGLLVNNENLGIFVYNKSIFHPKIL